MAALATHIYCNTCCVAREIDLTLITNSEAQRAKFVKHGRLFKEPGMAVSYDSHCIVLTRAAGIVAMLPQRHRNCCIFTRSSAPVWNAGPHARPRPMHYQRPCRRYAAVATVAHQWKPYLWHRHRSYKSVAHVGACLQKSCEQLRVFTALRLFVSVCVCPLPPRCSNSQAIGSLGLDALGRNHGSLPADGIKRGSRGRPVLRQRIHGLRS